MANENVQKDIVSGSPYDAAFYPTSAKYKEGRMPHVGQKVSFRDGREYVFCSTASVFAAGEIIATATALNTVQDGKCTAAAIGATSVTIDTTAMQFFGGSAGVLAANRMSGGYIVVETDAGIGYTYKIKSHAATTSAASGVFTLYDGLVVALTTASDIFFIGPKYDVVIQCTASLAPVGVAVVVTTDATSTNLAYFWAQTKGLGCVLIGTGTSIAIGLEISASASGKCILAAATLAVIGVAMATDTTADAALPIMLNIV